MDNLTKEFLEKEAARMAKMLEHIKQGHVLQMYFDPQEEKIIVDCETGVDHIVMHRMLHDDLPGDTCVEEGQEWTLEWDIKDTYAHHTGEDFKAS